VSGLEVMASLTNWFRECRKCHRDDNGSRKIVKRDDHLMDATGYLNISGVPARLPNRNSGPGSYPGHLTVVRHDCKAAHPNRNASGKNVEPGDHLMDGTGTCSSAVGC
jgi:hypothetical protein